LLVAATGHGPEEVTTVTENDVEFFPGGVRLRLAKNRAGLLRHRTFRDSSPSEDSVAVVEFVDRPRRRGDRSAAVGPHRQRSTTLG
jgi:hypothetical protein